MCQLWLVMTSPWRHKPAVLYFEVAILDPESAVDNDDIEKYMNLL